LGNFRRARGLEPDPDPYTFHITLSQPYPQLRYLMAMHFTTPLAHEAVEQYGKELARPHSTEFSGWEVQAHTDSLLK
jgi:hypothetical protein